jgi:tyrosine decarboxylase
MKDKLKDRLDYYALFLGPKSENIDFFQKTVRFMIEEHAFWRRDFHPEDEEVISVEHQNKENFIATEAHIKSVLLELSSKLKTTSMPWHSPRYLGHMNSEVLMPAMLAYISAMLYNPNNVAYEASTATSPMEIEVGEDFVSLMGYEKGKGWGHICTDGSIANYEAVWYARNMKSIPLAVKKVKPELVLDKDEWQLLNMSPTAILDLADKVKDVWETVKCESVRGVGMNAGQLGALLVPQSKHYSWVKAADILGLGLDNVISVQVDAHYRMDIEALSDKITELTAKKIPIMAVVGVMGTTEEGAIDHLDKIVALRSAFEKKGVSFYIHADAAYGGYVRSIFLDEDNHFMPIKKLKKELVSREILHESVDWPSQSVYDAFKALADVDSITIDPHKMGYIPYAAGGIVIKDKRMLDTISFFAAYVFEKGTSSPALLGSYIMEGSKAGATAASVWAAHRVVPLNIRGYGRIIGASIEGAHLFYQLNQSNNQLNIDGVKVQVECLIKPDFNMVDFAFNIAGNTSLEKMNQLNLALYNHCSYVNGPLAKDDFITSHTDFSHEDYGDAPLDFVNRLGIPNKEWNTVQHVRVLRACVLSPYLIDKKIKEEYWGIYLKSIREKLEKIIPTLMG